MVRNKIKDFVRKQFEEKYQAKIEDFYPEFFFKEKDGYIGFCAGFRSPDQVFFSECYLGMPIETYLKQHFSLEIQRKCTVEIGNFASTDVKSFQKNLIEMIRFLKNKGFLYILCTLTKDFIRFLDFYSVPYSVLSDADRNKVKNPKNWGNYYDNDPKVVLIKMNEFITKS